MLNLTWDVSRMNAMLSGISQGIGVGLPRVVTHEATKIFEGASKNTKAADRSKIITSAEREITARHNNFAGAGRVGKNSRSVYPRISVSSQKGKTWMKFQSGGKWYIMQGPGGGKSWQDRTAPSGARWSAARWAQFQALEAERLASLNKAIPQNRKARLLARGLAKRSWLEVAKAAGLVFQVPGYVAKAVPVASPLIMADFRARVIRGETSFAIQYENALPYITYIGGQAAINRAILGRIKYFETTMAKMTGDTFAAMAKRYGGLVTR